MLVISSKIWFANTNFVVIVKKITPLALIKVKYKCMHGKYSEPGDNKEVISVKGRFFNFFGKEIRGVIEWFQEIKTVDQWGTGQLKRTME